MSDTTQACRPLILLTNDDDVRSPGLLAAAEALLPLGDLLVVAPANQQTGMGRSSPILLDGDIAQEALTVAGQPVPAYSVPGSPAQSVVQALLVLAPRRPALVVSGINYGENVGTSVTVSGTVGAALEGATAGIPALAVSLETEKAYHYHHGTGLDWSTAAEVTRRLAQRVLAEALPPDVDVLNVNVPEDATPDTPWRVTRQSRQTYYVTFRTDTSSDPRLARLDYRIGVDWQKLEAGSDIEAFTGERVVSITPLSIDLTSRTDLGALQHMLS